MRNNKIQSFFNTFLAKKVNKRTKVELFLELSVLNKQNTKC